MFSARVENNQTKDLTTLNSPLLKPTLPKHIHQIS